MSEQKPAPNAAALADAHASIDGVIEAAIVAFSEYCFTHERLPLDFVNDGRSEPEPEFIEGYNSAIENMIFFLGRWQKPAEKDAP